MKSRKSAQQNSNLPKSNKEVIQNNNHESTSKVVEDHGSKQRKILINHHPKIFNFLTFISPLSVAFAILIVYVMQGRWSGYLPTISETATEYPNNHFFSIAMSTGSLMNWACLFSHVIYLQQYSKCSDKLIKLLFFLATTAAIGTGGTGLFSINEDHKHHFLFAFTGFVSILIFEFVANFAQKSVPNHVKNVRSFSLFLGFFGLILFGGLDWYLSARKNTTVTAIGEYILLFCMMYIVYTYHNELEMINFYIVFY